jgi:hypothetical protein
MITNNSDISLALAVWLLHDEYDYVSMPNYISATALMKPLRHIVLAPRVDASTQPADVADFIARALGHSLHDSVEKAWNRGYTRSLKLLGYPDSLIERIQINPTDEQVRGSNSIIPVYLEQRMFREYAGFTIGGKFDMVTEGMIQDAKSTSAFTWLYGGKDDDYRLQMSLYRWLDAAQPLPKITEDVGRINFIFTDWQKSAARSNPKYPQQRVEHKEIVLSSLEETEEWVRRKLALIVKHRNTPEHLLPECTDDELWRSDPVYKYYADPSKTAGRSTRNFDTAGEASAFKAEKGKGVVITVPGEPKRCSYCEAFSVCTQKDRYFPT